MNNAMVTPFVIVGLLIASLGVWIIFSGIQGAIRRRSSWIRTDGRMTMFGFRYGAPSVLFEYQVDGKVFEGNKLLPGKNSRRDNSSACWLPKSAYVRSDGSLKFPPDSQVDVFYDPKNSEKCALIPGFPPIAMLCLPAILVAFGLIMAGGEWIVGHCKLVFPGLFICAGLLMCCVGLRWGRRYTRSRKFPSVKGLLLKAELAYEDGSDADGFGLQVEFEYEVNGTPYRSNQLTAINARILSKRVKQAQSLVDGLLTNPQPQVFYDPRAPWDGFLRHGPTWGIFGIIFVGLIFTGIGAALAISISGSP